MNFRDIPIHLQPVIYNLTKDEQFQKRFQQDKTLDQIEAQKTNFKDQYCYQQILHNGTITINDRKYNVLSPSVWSYLWVIQSPFLNADKEISVLDLNIFLYLLEYGVGDADIMRITNASIGYIDRNNISIEDAVLAVKRIVELSFKPLCLFARSDGSGAQPEYDLDWLTSIVARIHPLTGYAPEFILNNMSLTQVCYYFAQCKRIAGDKSVYKRTPQEIIKAMDERTTELVVERLIEIGAISEQEKQKYIQMISTPPKK